MRIFLSIVLIAGSLFSQQPSAADVLEKIRSRYQQMNDAAATFTQTVKLRYSKNGQPMSGTVKIKKGNKYRVETQQQIIVTDGVTVWMYTPKTKQVLVDRFRANRQPFSPDKFLLGLPSDFTSESVVTNDSQFVLTLVPKAGNVIYSSIASLTVWTTEEQWLVNKIEIVEKNGTSKIITLTDIQFNKGIADAAFRFSITSDMHVVDMKTLQ
jgi:outer membrane lipoprotein carrier protein